MKRTSEIAGDRVERWPPAERTWKTWQAIGGDETLVGLRESFEARTLPAVAAVVGGATYLSPIALEDNDLVFFGWGLQPDLCRTVAGEAVLEELAAVARATERQGLVTAVTNADFLPLGFLQGQGFTLTEIRPLEETGKKGFQGIVKTHLFVLRKAL